MLFILWLYIALYTDKWKQIIFVFEINKLSKEMYNMTP